MRYRTYLSIVALVLAIGVSSCLKPNKRQKFMPINDLYKEDVITPAIISDTAVSREFFYQLLNDFQEKYSPIVSQVGGQLVVHGDWQNPTVNAQANQADGLWNVLLFGGLARRPEITKDGFTLVVCHEMGHHLAGYPFYSGSWGSTEGQSDYYSGMACARDFWIDDLSINAAYRSIIPDIPKKECDASWYDQENKDLCYRIMMAAKSTTNLLATLSGTSVSFKKRDATKVEKTYESHPLPQCRLDTYMAAAICISEWDISIIPGRDLFPNQNSKEAEAIAASITCSRFHGFKRGLKPLCWYAPKN